jgi:hypothetical protein
MLGRNAIQHTPYRSSITRTYPKLLAIQPRKQGFESRLRQIESKVMNCGMSDEIREAWKGADPEA